MKKWAFGTMAVAVVMLGTVAYVQAADEVKGERGVIVGTAISIADYGMTGAAGEDAIESATFHAEQGFPVGILEEETGEVWIAVWRDSAPASHLETANEQMKPLMGKMVTASGLLYRQDGVNVIRMSLISEY